MVLEEKINAFVLLGEFMKQFSSNEYKKNENLPFNDLYFDTCKTLIDQSVSHNGWFTKDQVLFSLGSWSEALVKENIEKWLSAYDLSNESLKTIGLILAGNIPLVGFHDVIAVLVSGNKALIKLSSNDQKLLPLLLRYLTEVAPDFKERITITEEKFDSFDAVIATGSNNTSRYFEYYFNKVPNIIRKNRNSVAVLTGEESQQQLEALGEDIFRYYGLGCRNVSKLFVPQGYDFTSFFEAMYAYREVIEYEKYANNYDYNKAVFLMSNYSILDNGFLTIREDKNHASPISSVFYEYYTDIKEVEQRLNADKEHIQCVVSAQLTEKSIPFGTTQKPALWDYADDVDTLKFLLNL